MILLFIYNSACKNSQDFVCRVCDGKGTYSHGTVINIKISGQLFSRMGSVSQLHSHRMALALRTRVKPEEKEEKNLGFFCCSFTKAVFRLILKMKLSVR